MTCLYFFFVLFLFFFAIFVLVKPEWTPITLKMSGQIKIKEIMSKIPYSSTKSSDYNDSKPSNSLQKKKKVKSETNPVLFS